MPRLILNAGNSDSGIYRVTRHDFLNGACARCVSRADQHSRGPEESAARRLGLRVEDVMPYLLANQPLPEELLARATITSEERDQLRGRKAKEAFGIVCGTFSPLPELPALSMPALSASPGVLLAAELVKSRMGAGVPLDARRGMLATGLFSGPHPRWLSARGKRLGCECTDAIYRQAYRDRWSPQS